MSMTNTKKRKEPDSSTSAANNISQEELATCYICLGEGPDEKGNPLVRDCSCRGSAGWAHLQCLFDYAEQQSVGGRKRDSGKLIKAWTACPNCHQSYEHKLADDMVDRCKAFVDESFPGDLWYQSHASYLKLRTLAIASENKDGAVHIANVVLGQVAQVKERFPIERVPVAFLYFEVTAWESLALFAESDDTKEGMKQAIEYHTKCCDVYKIIGNPTDIAHAEANILRAKAKYSGDKSIWTPEDLIKDCLDYWNESIAESGEESSVSLISLFRYAEALKGAKLTIQSERMLLKLIAMANRVHGEKHDFTQDAKSTLERYRRRYVFVRGHRGSHFQALRYEDNERKVVVQGPIAKPRNMEEETQMTVHVDMQRPALGVPVKLYGLEGDESHLNGKISNVKSREKGARKYLVHFIEEGLEPCLISPRNMKIMFQLPREVLEDWE